ncbi:hypothetical protein Pla144_02230 [Bythopirellula polymerisocia]|uniref:BioF2-like acetyltransferase domain-containing protein n=2 Tax=Bythopirellula polymerisocia TaxID=2528003 RepID=A0A5C6CZT7_9BACT|nr:hypothetical protein Pla144_02230 [Bythopirellula polymerisocia]
MAEVIEINSLEELQPYQLAWNALHLQTPRASFFQTYDWFVTFWRHHGANQQMRVLIVRSSDSTIGILPLCIVEKEYRLTTVRVLTYPLSDWGMWYGPLGPNRSATLFMALQHLRNTHREWDVIDLCWTSGASGDGDATRRAMSAAGWQPQSAPHQESSVVRFSETNWEDYHRGLSKKWRHEIRRQTRNLQREGTVEFIRHRPQSAADGDGDPRWDLFDQCVEISRGGWQAKVTNGNTLCHDSVLEFLTDCHAQAARLGMMDMAILQFAGTPVAFQYNYFSRGEVSGLRMGYLSAMRDKGVGKLLLAKFIEDSFERGDQSLDLGIGEYDFKSRFRTNVETSYRYCYYPWNALRGQGVRLTQWLKQRLTNDRTVKETKAKPAIA